MQGTVINVMSKAKKKTQIRNLGAHNAQIGKAVGNRDDSLKGFNFDVLELGGEKSISNYDKYIKEHMHIGYNAYKEDLKEGDFILPRDGKDISKVESIVVAPDIKVPLKDLKDFNFTEVKSFFLDYIFTFMKNDIKFKDIKILSAKVHCNEVFYPRFKTIEKDGKEVLVKLSKEESRELAYIKVHMHVDYIPLVETEKKGIKFLKCSSKDIWKSVKGRYFDSFREYNDRLYAVLGKEYNFDRGEKWEEWDERVQKKNNGEAVKGTIKLSEWQIQQEEEMNNKYIAQLDEERQKHNEKSEEYKKLSKEIEAQKNELYVTFQQQEMEYNRQIKEKNIELEKKKKEIASKEQEIKDKEKAIKTKDSEIASKDAAIKDMENEIAYKENQIKDVDNLMVDTDKLREELKQDKIDLEKQKKEYNLKKAWMQEECSKADAKVKSAQDAVKIAASLEADLQNKLITEQEAEKQMELTGIDKLISDNTFEETPLLNKLIAGQKKKNGDEEGDVNINIGVGR